jgi:hypothetical protein
VSYQPAKTFLDRATILARRRAEILAEYRHFQLEPIKIAGEPISMELALLLGLLVDREAAE